MISFVMANTRGKDHPDWVQIATNSVKRQVLPVELIEVKNPDSYNTGVAWNQGVKKATGEWVAFIGDEDYISDDMSAVLQHFANKVKDKNIVAITTRMTVFDGRSKPDILKRAWTGMVKREYLLKHPFNEKLESGIDREYFELLNQRGDKQLLVPYHFGYFYRRHQNNMSGHISIHKKPQDIYITANSPVFIDPIAKRLMKHYGVIVDTEGFNSEYADKAKLIWCDWGNIDAIHSADFKCKAKKILRIHAFEVYNNRIDYIDFNKFDKVIFVAQHIREFLEKRLNKKIRNSVIIPNGIDLNEFTISKKKKINKKIAWAGNVTSGKGIQLVIFLARNFPQYEFHIAGRIPQLDVLQYLGEKAPSNVFLYSYQHDMPDFFKDKTYVLSTSIRESQHLTIMEGMASGLKPIVYDWIGSRKIYGKENVFNDMFSFDVTVNGKVEPEKYRKHIQQHYNFEKIYPKIEKLIGDLI